MVIVPRDYQFDMINKIRLKISNGVKHILAQLSTGGGKTVIFSYIAQNAVKKGKRVLIITDRDELLNQAGGSIKSFNLNPQYIKAGTKHIDRRRDIFIAMSQTLRNRIGRPEWDSWILDEIDIVIIDECHGQEFNYLFESTLLDNKIVLGFTATPERKGKMRQLALDYDVMVRGIDIRELIKKGYLLNCDLYDCGSPDLDGVRIDAKTGDFSGSSMYNTFDKPKLYTGLVKAYQKYTPNEKMIVFCCNVEHAIKTCQELSNAGYDVKFLASKKSPPKQPKANASGGEIERYKERLRVYNIYKDNYNRYSGSRANIIKDFKANKFTILVNVDMLTKGFDDPTIKVVCLYRATMSLSLYLQMIGRGARICDDIGKTHFTVFDFGGNAERHGKYDEPKNWGLWHESKSKSLGVPPLKTCGFTNTGNPKPAGGDVKKGCKRLVLASYQICPFCGFKEKQRDLKEEVDLMLSSIKDEQGVTLKVKAFKDMDFIELKKYREIKGHKSAWLWRQLWIRGGESELKEFASFAKWNKSTTERALNYCNNVL